MSRSLGSAVRFNINKFKRDGSVSVRADQLEFYRGLLSPKITRKFVHKTLGEGYTLFK